MVRYEGDDDYLALLLLAETPARAPRRFTWVAPLLIAGVDVFLAMQLARWLDQGSVLLLALSITGLLYTMFRT